MINNYDYVVLDVETNGTSSVNDDLLSISLYRPDNNSFLNRFLPLELNSKVYTTHINGIRKKDLSGKKPISQKEFDEIINDFELNKRTILTYGNIDEKFLVNYCRRHGLHGCENFKFYNFKHLIITSRFSSGVASKDNLCRFFSIDGVSEIHTSENDCKLEWQLFTKLNYKPLLVIGNRLYELNSNFMIPASYLFNYPNIVYNLDLPLLYCSAKEIYRTTIKSKNIPFFNPIFKGQFFEEQFNLALNVDNNTTNGFVYENVKKMSKSYLGEISEKRAESTSFNNLDSDVLIVENDNGKYISFTNDPDNLVITKALEKLNNASNELKNSIKALCDYLKSYIFKNSIILSQEIVINKLYNIYAICDLTNEETVVEIKTDKKLDLNKYKYQLYFEANGRKCFVLHVDSTNYPNTIDFVLYEISFSNESKSKRKKTYEERYNYFCSRLNNPNVEVLIFTNVSSNVKLKCNVCGYMWIKNAQCAIKNSKCPICEEKRTIERNKNTKERKKQSELEKKQVRINNYKMKISEKSNNSISVLEYSKSNEPVTAKCKICGHIWSKRADKLLERCYCPICHKYNKHT